MNPHKHQAPTPNRLTYLKALAGRTATTFTYPRSSSEASREINRLKQLQPLTAEERTPEVTHRSLPAGLTRSR